MNQPPNFNHSRIASIDFLRGIVMLLMALDHTRDYFHYGAFIFDPLDLSQTNSALFLTRFITHYCAPVFVFLAGTSAFLVGQRRSRKSLSIWLLKRGIWLVIVEITIIKLAWFFDLDFSWLALQVIWVLGISMIFLAGFIHIPKKIMIPLALIGMLIHNAFDGLEFSGTPGIWWSFLHVQSMVTVSNINIFIAYPAIPWIFVMALGYHFGSLYKPSTEVSYRYKFLTRTGIGMLLLYLILRIPNLYGDMNHWNVQDDFMFTMLSFINVTKYPPSLLYLLITLGPSLLLLAAAERWSGKIYDRIVIVGRVPMFYYIIHIYIIHGLATLAAVLSGYSASEMIFNGWGPDPGNLEGYGYNLLVVYLVWIGIILGMYPICRWYYGYKRKNRDQWWLSYL